jgi:hypothetical protein
MPDYYCSACDEEFFDRSEMAVLSPCQLCGAEETVSLAESEPLVPEPVSRSVDPRVEARAAAEALLVERGVTGPPVDVVSIAEALGLQVSYTALGDVDGELREGRIRVNKDHDLGRQRFTIAHELGHLRLHTHHGGRGKEAERQADAFAGALLLPPALLGAAVAAEPDFERLRRRFVVSRPALMIALTQANLISNVSSS